MNFLLKLAVGVAFIAIFLETEDFVNKVLIDQNLIEKPLNFKSITGCEFILKLIGNAFVKRNQKEEEKIFDKPTLKLKKELMKIIKQNTKEKNLKEKIADTYQKLRDMITMRNIKMPCLFGNCKIGDKIKKERAEYERMQVKKTKMNKNNVFVSDKIAMMAEEAEEKDKKHKPTF